MSNYIIGVDGGSQSTKVVIYDLTGRVVSEGKQSLKPMHTPEPGVVEHPEDDLWDSLIKATQKALADFPGERENIIGLGLCTIRFCRALLKDNGELASPVMSWMDERVSQVYEHTNSDVAYVTTSSGYITHKLTGELRDAVANYQGMWPVDTDSWDWIQDESVFNEYNIPRRMLFELQSPGTILGYITERVAVETGIPEGTPVVATANDKAVEALGAGMVHEDKALISLGTYIAGMVPSSDNVTHADYFWTNFASIPNRYLHESHGIRRGMWTVSWFKDLFGEDLIDKASNWHMSPEEYLNQEAEGSVPAGSDGLITILDWLAPTDKPYRKGMFLGFDERHTRTHMYHSILEAIALTMKQNIDALCQERGITFEEVVVTGGGSSGDLMMQLIANVFGLPTVRTEVNGAASLGAAINTAVALGEYHSYSEAIDYMVRTEKRFEADQDKHKFYHRLNQEVYQHVTDYTDGIMKKLYSLYND